MRLSVSLREAFDEAEESVSIEHLLDRLGYKSFGMLLILLGLPAALPIPIPGAVTPFGAALFLVCLQIALRREHPWVPQSVSRRELHPKNDSKFVDSLVSWIAFLERFVRPRLGILYSNHISYRALGAFMMLCSCSIMIPIPLTNGVPGIAIAIIGLGMLEEDGLAAVVGVATGIYGVALSATVLTLLVISGWAGVEWLWERIPHLVD